MAQDEKKRLGDTRASAVYRDSAITRGVESMRRAELPNYPMIAPAQAAPGPNLVERQRGNLSPSLGRMGSSAPPLGDTRASAVYGDSFLNRDPNAMGPNPALEGSLRGNVRPPLRAPGPSLLERQRANLSPSLRGGQTAAPPAPAASSAPPLGDTRASAVYGDSFITRGANAARDWAVGQAGTQGSPEDSLLDAWRQAFPSFTSKSAAAQQNVIDAYGRAGVAGGVGAALRGIPQAGFGLIQDLGRTTLSGLDARTRPLAQGVDELVTGDSTDPLTLGQIANWMTGEGDTTAAPATAPASAPAPATAAPRSATGRGPAPATDTRNPRGWISDGTRTLSIPEGSAGPGTPGNPGLLRNMERNQEGRTALEEFAAANATRQQTIDAMPRGAGIVRPQEDSLTTQVTKLMTAANRERDVNKSSALRKQADALIRASQVQTQGDTAMMRERGEMARANQNADIERSYREAIAEAALTNADAASAELLARGNQPVELPSWLTPENLPMMRDILSESGLQPEEQASIYNSMLSTMIANATRPYAEGGLVEPPSAMGRAPAMLTPQMPGQQIMAEYQQLNSGLSAMGLAPVDFETFQSLKAPPQMQNQPGASAGVMGFAEGGMVPDVSGKMVVDTDPAAPTDSIPAMVDGAQPAALDSGEFVLPKDVVMFYGLDKLNKMIAQARKVESDGPNTGQPGVSAIESAQRYA